ncbi:hypothetical protein [uncultured Oscillibacter sp.]|jgi:hypothetical protein|nr:hypothetical protein [uncultured Oscillibacter sp.]
MVIVLSLHITCSGRWLEQCGEIGTAALDWLSLDAPPSFELAGQKQQFVR